MKRSGLQTWMLLVAAVGLLLQTVVSAYGQANGRVAGRVVAWGSNSIGQTAVPDHLDDAIAIVAGNSHSLALKQDGTVVAWGNNSSGQCDVPLGLSEVVAIAAGAQYCLALKSDDTIVAWGELWGTGTVLDEPELKDAVSIAAGSWVILVLKSDGTITRRVYRESTEMDVALLTAVPPGLSGVVAIANFGLSSLALNQDGTVVGWGGTTSEYTPPDGLDSVVAVAAGNHHLAVQGHGTVVAWGRSTSGNTEVPGDLSGVVTIAAGWFHSLALKADGTVVAWGDNRDGQSTVPADLKGVVAVAGGRAHSLAIVVDPQPILDARLANGGLRLSWPASATDYLLETTHDLSIDSWTMPPEIPAIIDSEFVLTVESSDGHRFYRLRQP